MTLGFPKPAKLVLEPVQRLNGGREVCELGIAAGRRIYKSRIEAMLERQNRRCCLDGYCPTCPGYLELTQATFEHEFSRGMGGSKRDDRIVLPDGTWINGAAHRECNSWKGSRYIPYNRSFQQPRPVDGPPPCVLCGWHPCRCRRSTHDKGEE